MSDTVSFVPVGSGPVFRGAGGGLGLLLIMIFVCAALWFFIVRKLLALEQPDRSGLELGV